MDEAPAAARRRRPRGTASSLRPLPLSGSSASAAEPVDAGVDLAVDLLRQRRGGELGGRILGEAGHDLEAAQQRLAHPAARAAARRLGLEAGPAELRRHDDLARRRLRASRRERAARRRRALRQHEVARIGGMQDQRRPVGDAEDDDVFARPRADAHRLAAAALRADANRRAGRGAPRRPSARRPAAPAPGR